MDKPGMPQLKAARLPHHTFAYPGLRRVDASCRPQTPQAAVQTIFLMCNRLSGNVTLSTPVGRATGFIFRVLALRFNRKTKSRPLAQLSNVNITAMKTRNGSRYVPETARRSPSFRPPAKLVVRCWRNSSLPPPGKFVAVPGETRWLCSGDSLAGQPAYARGLPRRFEALPVTC